jgi:hypothetical protein
MDSRYGSNPIQFVYFPWFDKEKNIFIEEFMAAFKYI